MERSIGRPPRELVGLTAKRPKSRERREVLRKRTRHAIQRNLLLGRHDLLCVCDGEPVDEGLNWGGLIVVAGRSLMS
jgi:hypothetical protein